ncbi:TonB-dependent receptor [Flavipsychrobacter stenotrophus]|uniref:TonB-dependent receptor n=1 Tax=Flavipsychrobacter stenotrophus TaxID=2077091 RepID=A0A2S7SXL3_9BACT|nr:TonB-dependent receptor [Flavipsychrobacter stenotrophus]PQJ11672.1 TonB-dependent receptor [Flavipsychrobacter stenotrophus]
MQQSPRACYNIKRDLHSGKHIIVTFCLLLIWAVIPLSLHAQGNKQNIRGSITDKLSLVPLRGAMVQIVNDSASHQALSDSNGNYTLRSITPGRYELRIINNGYKDVYLPNVIVASGKETILDISIEETFKRLKEVVISSSDKGVTINKLATVSARTFSMEEVNRYAGGRSDPARLVANFAGVSAPDDSRNDIVIRGNSPVGVCWRIDGMNVTNPNHFATVGTTGGAVSALNTNMLKNSDFFTSAFPAEYGNAIAGVFDLGFRTGNTEKREHTVQLGLVTGLEGMTEGPLAKGSGASYLVAYRQSVAFLASTFGINIGTSATPAYKDLSFKITSGNTKLGTFSLFGILANSSIGISGGKSGSLYAPPDNTDLYSAIGIIGIKHVKILNKRSYITSSLGVNYAKNTQYQSSADSSNNSRSIEEEKVIQTAYTASVAYNNKINSRLFFKVGLQDQLINLDLYYRTRRNMPDWMQIWDNNNATHLAQAYAHLKYNITERLTANVGLHTQKLFLNTRSTSLEPRIAFKYDVGKKSSLTMGFGLHAQMQPINIYYNQIQNATATNKDLGFTKSQHYVLGYDWQPFKDWRVKAEIYYQYLYDVPVDSISGSYSMLNTGSSFKPDLSVNLKNNGTGTNYGAELTIEKFFSKGYYGLFTSSVYESKYKGSDGVEHNTAFNGKYVYNLLVGKEFKVGSDKRNKFTTDLKFTNAGGRFHTPIDLATSQMVGNTVLKSDTYAYTSRYDNYFRLDFKLGFALNSKSRKLSQTFSLDLQNVTNHQNVFSQSYDNGSKTIMTSYQLGFFPNFIYKLQF